MASINMSKNQKEENPFELRQVAEEWIRSVEGEKGFVRDGELYPYLRKWVAEKHCGTLIEIGAGQGICSDKIDANDFTTYFGVEPSKYLVKRAQFLYKTSNRQFSLGDAYNLPFGNTSVDAAFSVNVWFHLADLDLAATELNRVLKTKGRFLIITANPKANYVWESFFLEKKKEGKKISGKITVPINPLSSSVIYDHTLEDIKRSLESNSLHVNHIEKLGNVKEIQEPLFIAVSGEKV